MNKEMLSETEKELKSLGLQEEFKKSIENPTVEAETMNENLERLKLLLDDKSIPSYLRKKQWALADKELAITNFTPKDLLRVRNKHKIIELLSICDMPPNSLTFSQELDLSQMDLKVFIKGNRSLHGFERMLQNTDIKQMRIKADSAGGKKSRMLGGVGRLFGRKGDEG